VYHFKYQSEISFKASKIKRCRRNTKSTISKNIHKSHESLNLRQERNESFQWF
jgi:hypothetical protein